MGAFASNQDPPLDELLAAPVRTPRPSRLQRALTLPRKAAEGAEALGLRTVADLLEHVPRARREARTVGALSPGETATVLVEVRSIASRAVRRRGMRPLVEATVADATGPMKATFFNQPWLVKRYEPGTRLVLHGKYEGRNRFRVANHATTDEAAASGEEVSHYAATRGALEHADPRPRHGRARRPARRRRRAAGADARAPEARGARRGARGDALRRERERGRGRPRAARLRGAPADPARAARPARARGLGRARLRARSAGHPQRALADGGPALRADRRPARGDRRSCAASSRASARPSGC